MEVLHLWHPCLEPVTGSGINRSLSGSSFLSNGFQEEGMECVVCSTVYLAELLCMSSSLSSQSWKRLGAVNYCVSDDLVEHA